MIDDSVNDRNENQSRDESTDSESRDESNLDNLIEIDKEDLDILPKGVFENLDKEDLDDLTKGQFEKKSTSVSPAEQRKNINTYISGILALGLWLGLLGTVIFQLHSISNITSLYLQNSTNKIDETHIDKASSLINDSCKTIYTFLGPIATAVTAYYFTKVNASSNTSDEENG